MNRLLLFLFIVAQEVQAIEHLHCDQVLTYKLDAEKKVTLGSRQILLRGKLATGREKMRTVWGIQDQEFISLQKLHSGDQLHLLNTRDQVSLSGYYGREPGYEHRPSLYQDPHLNELAINPSEFMGAFFLEERAVVIRSLSAEFKRHWRRQVNSSKSWNGPYIKVGKAWIEQAEDEVVIVGEPMWSEYNQVQVVVDRKSGLARSPISVRPTLQMVIKSHGVARMVSPGDRVLFFDHSGQIFLDEAIDGPLNLVTWTHLMEKAATAAVIYRRPQIKNY